jgi:hypothetical protein
MSRILAALGVWKNSASAITKPTRLTLAAPNTDDRSIDRGDPSPSLGDMSSSARASRCDGESSSPGVPAAGGFGCEKPDGR